jgi:hypothetical protein
MPSDFTMLGARRAMADGLLHIEKHIKAIEQAVNENPGLAFDLARTVVETTCRTILTERKISFEVDDDLPSLFKTVTRNLPLLPLAASGEAAARKSLAQTLSGLHTALQGMCRLRNAYGFASHGAEGPRPAMETVQALLAAQAADAIVGFLYRVHRQERAGPRFLRLSYDDHEVFNAYVDEANEVVRVFDLEYRPSEVLFGIDQEAYRDLLSSFDPEVT